MPEISYAHIVEYDSATNKIVVYRLMASGDKHLYTEIPVANIEARRRTLEGIGVILGEALILDMYQLRKSIV